MKAFHIFSSLFLIACLASACDNIADDDRYYTQPKPVVENPRNLLIMEFTGNSCKNCPNGASMIDQIKQDEGANRVISVGLHPYGDINTNPVVSKYTSPEKQDFRSQAATALYDYYCPSGFPCAVFNGLKSSMSGSIPDWMQRASDALNSTAAMSIDAVSAFNPDNRNLLVNYTVNFGNVVEKRLNVTVWLVENNIMGTQTMPNGKLNLDYEHNHVLRTSLNGDWGEYIGDSFDSDSVISKSAEITLSEKWVAENCRIVIFVYAESDKEVQQVVQIPVL